MSESPIIVSYPGNEALAEALALRARVEPAPLELRAFPDGESHVRLGGPIEGREVTVVCTLHQPDALFLRLAMIASTARDLGASRLVLVAPYLSYMRQDERFRPGDGVTSRYFARLLSGIFEELITVDPHLHRWSSLDEIYTLQARRVSAAPAIAGWVREHVEAPVIVGPDAESAQWVEALAAQLEVPSVVLEKVRHGDRDVSIDAAGLEAHEGCAPVVLDDIVSTGRTMAETVALLAERGFEAPRCVAVHAVFADEAGELLREAGARELVTCDTIPHPSNAISVHSLIAEAWGR